MERGVLCYIVREHPMNDGRKICLAVKKKKIGTGLLNGYGGHVEKHESSLFAAIRELQEKAGLKEHEEALCKDGALCRVAQISYWEGDEHRVSGGATHLLCWQVDIFLVRDAALNDSPRETNEMGPPEWFYEINIPYDKMMPADRYILPLILACAKFDAEVYYGVGKKVVESVIVEPWKK